MQLQQLIKGALKDAGLLDYAVDSAEAAMLREGEAMARQSVDALNNDPALSFGLDTIDLDNLDSTDIFFPLRNALLTEREGAILLES
jgi:hypothetical protein